MCKHHWQLESPSGKRNIKGVCKFCGAERLYDAAYDEDKFNGVPLRIRNKSKEYETAPLNEVTI